MSARARPARREEGILEIMMGVLVIWLGIDLDGI